MCKGSLMNGLQSITQWQDYFGSPSGSVLGVVNAAQSIGSVISLPVVGILSDCVTDRDSGNQRISDSHVTPSSIRATQHNSFMFSFLFLSLA
jgi:hypothetical protein